VILNRIATQPTIKATPYPGPETEPQLGDWERTLFGIDNPETAAELMEHWKFDPTIRLAIRNQYDPIHDPAAPPEAALLNCAGWVVHQLGKSIPGEANYWTRDSAKLARAGISDDLLDSVVEEVRTELDTLKSAVSH
jgi:HD-like signal output (HDOD) protein